VSQPVIERLVTAVGKILLGKEPQIRLALSCLLAKGHLLLEDLPGMGKTTLSHALAKVLGLSYQRIQFTSDLLPADIIGTSIFNPGQAQFEFRKGPVFAEVLLADEINRATPKTQGALLEAMEEHQVTVEGHSYPLPQPFFVIATQNPVTQMGTFPLPESQLDRFLMRISLGYPDPKIETCFCSSYNSLFHGTSSTVFAPSCRKANYMNCKSTWMRSMFPMRCWITCSEYSPTHGKRPSSVSVCHPVQEWHW